MSNLHVTETAPEVLERMMHAALAAADPRNCVRRVLNRVGRDLVVDGEPVRVDGKLIVVGTGKAAYTMGSAAIEIAGALVDRGALVAKTGPAPDLPSVIELALGDHPVPGPRSLRATRIVRELLNNCSAGDVVLCLISGGSSALLTAPILEPDEWQDLNRALLASGCPIEVFNTVRTALDLVKGGGLARWAYPARVVTLILSDVLGNPLESIGSGPTVHRHIDRGQLTEIFQTYHIQDLLEPRTWSAIKTYFESKGAVDPDPLPEVRNIVVGDIRLAAEAAAEVAREAGFDTQITALDLEGEASEVGMSLGQLAAQLPSGCCRILGGETTVTLGGEHGKGGRNQELALAAAIALQGVKRRYLMTLATDGEDGPTDAAGALVSGDTIKQATLLGLDARDYLARHDAYHFFDRFGFGHLRPGSTGTNVNDLVFILSEKES